MKIIMFRILPAKPNTLYKGFNYCLVMALTQIRRGIYSLNSTDIPTDKSPVVAVHPYFNCGVVHNGRVGNSTRLIINEKSQYIQNFECIARDLGRLLITFEEVSRLDLTVQRYRELGRSERTYFVKTRDGFGIPIGLWGKWKNPMDFLKEFGDNSIDVVGGCYNEDDSYDNCLGSVVRRLERFGLSFTVLKEVTFY